MLTDKLKNLPASVSLKEAQEQDTELSSLLQQLLSSLSISSMEDIKNIENAAMADLWQMIDGGKYSNDIKKFARKQLYRLSTKGIKPSAVLIIKKESALPPPEFKEGYASEVDASGNQLLLGVFVDRLGSLTSTYFLGDENIGFKDVKVQATSRKLLEEYIRHYEDHHIHMTALKIEEFRWLVYRYIAEKETKPSTLAYIAAQKLLGKSPESPEICPLYAAFSWPNPEEEAAALAKLEQIVTPGEKAWWLPEDKVKTWKKKYEEGKEGVLVVNKTIKQEQLMELLNQAVEDIMTPEFSPILKGRLEAWACLLQAQADPDKAKAVLAAAHVLEAEPAGKDNPLIQQMAKAALEGKEASTCAHDHEEPEGHGHHEYHEHKEQKESSSKLWMPGKKKW